MLYITYVMGKTRYKILFGGEKIMEHDYFGDIEYIST